MKYKSIHLIAIVALGLISGPSPAADALPESDQRAKVVKDLNTLRDFPEIDSKAEWQARAREIREHVLVSCGLWPLPEKTPLAVEIFGRIEREDYTIEKVYFQTYPGFYLAGNLYRPKGKGRGPFPGVLNPHGHGAEGRLTDSTVTSIAGRCISFARQGMVAFSYDMAGYNDTIQLGRHRAFFNQPELQLWNISLMGLQTWNSIRALDFLESLPDVDRKRLACTGESGGGTQTFMLGAVDDRLLAQAPVVMVSHSMQGGCQCENAPGLRVLYSNMEIAAAAAPRRQHLVAATGDWTKLTMSVEGPSIEQIYRLFKAPDNLRYQIFSYDHNYNQTSREAVYESFGRWLLKHPATVSLREAPFKKEPDEDLRVWPDGKLPAGALGESAFILSLVAQGDAQWKTLQPHNPKSLARFKELMLPAYRHSLQDEFPERSVLAEIGEVNKAENCTVTKLTIGRAGRGDRLAAALVSPVKDSGSEMVILAHPGGRGAYLNPAGNPTGLAKMLVENGLTVLLLDAFLTGESSDLEASKARRPFEKFFTTYNRTDLQERVQDLITACAVARSQGKARRTIILCGVGRAGLWALLAAPAADAVVADCDRFDAASDQAMLTDDLFVPGIRRFGAFEGAAMLAAPHPLVLHNTADKFSTAGLRDTYLTTGAYRVYREESAALDDEAVAHAIRNALLRTK